MTPDDPAFMAMVERINPSAAKTIIAQVAAACDITPADITWPSHADRFAHPRFIVMVALRRLGWSLPKIGWVLGDRDHTTVMSGLNRAVQLWGDAAKVASIIVGEKTNGDSAEPQTPRHGPPIASQAVLNTEGTPK